MRSRATVRAIGSARWRSLPEVIGRGAFVKVGDTYDWSGGLWAVQQQLGLAIHPGGKTALELAGYGHFLPLERQSVMLFGATGVKLPHWLRQQAEVWQLLYFTTNLFAQAPRLGLTERRFGDLAINISTPERASLEMLYLVRLSRQYGVKCSESGILSLSSIWIFT